MMVWLIQGLISLVGRVALSAIFLLDAVADKIPNFNEAAGMVASKGMPAPKLMLAGAIAFLLAGSLSVIAGYKTRWGALLLFLFLAPTSYLFHDFWNAAPEAAHMQQIQFMKNLGLAGAFLFLIANGGGAWSLDGRRRAAEPTLPSDADEAAF